MPERKVVMINPHLKPETLKNFSKEELISYISFLEDFYDMKCRQLDERLDKLTEKEKDTFKCMSSDNIEDLKTVLRTLNFEEIRDRIYKRGNVIVKIHRLGFRYIFHVVNSNY